MQTKLNPYINFKRETRAAMQFYQQVFGGKLVMSTFKDYHASQSVDEDDLIMHAALETENGMTLLASDQPDRMEYHPGTNFTLALTGSNAAELTAYFQKLSQGGTITMPLAESIWKDTFGMCTDKFGMRWLVNISK
jgi:PhnB protein